MDYTEFQMSLLNETNLLLATMVIFLTTPCSYIVKMFIAKWTPHMPADKEYGKKEGDEVEEKKSQESLEDAGKYIGIFERLFVFVFVISSNWEAIGFLLAAKSVFRFGDLTTAKDRNLTEYILIGTLFSFGIAILIGMFYSMYMSK
jgi:hypothetical protein